MVVLVGTAFAACGFSATALADPAQEELTGVSCVSADNCWAVGFRPGPGLQVNQIWHRRAGHWARASAPTPSDSWLYGVSCTSSNNCWAVGKRSSHNQALHWNGSKWRAASTPTPAYSGLLAVSCASADDCWAVGNAGAQNEVLHWHGGNWSRIKTPQPGNQSGFVYRVLNGVACASAQECFAVGGYEAGNSELNETLRWNGSKWALVAAPQPGGTNAGAAVLQGVDCPSTKTCWTVGEESHSSSVSHNEAFRWNAGKWKAFDTPESVTNGNILNGVGCLSPESCWAVGYRGHRTQALRWDGSGWADVSTPNPGHDNTLFSVSCASANSCLAVGFRTKTDGGVNFNLALDWNGSKWSNVTP